jgi:hypothetical protein
MSSQYWPRGISLVALVLSLGCAGESDMRERRAGPPPVAPAHATDTQTSEPPGSGLTKPN